MQRRMRLWLPVAAIAAGLAALVWCWPANAPDPDGAASNPAIPAPAAPTPTPATSSLPTARDSVPDAPAAAEPAPPAADEGATSFAFDATLYGRDEKGLPRRAPWTGIAPEGASLVRYASFPRRTRDRGDGLRWSAPQPAGTLIVDSGLLRRVRLQAGIAVRIAVGEQRTPPWPGQEPENLASSDLDVLHTFGDALGPFAAFVDADEEHEGGRYESRFGYGSSHYFRVTGVVRAPDGALATRVHVELDRTGQTRAAAVSADGAFAFEHIPPGEYLVLAADDDGNTAMQPVLVDRDVTVSVSLVASPRLRGRVVDPSGKAVAEARMLWCGDNGDYDDRVVTRADGTFVLHVGEKTPGSLHACVPGDGARWPVVSARAEPDANDVALVLDRASSRGAMHVTVPTLPHLGARAVSARLWQEASGLGMPLARTRSDEQSCDFAAIALPAGHYRLELCAPAFGTVDGGTFWCDGRTEVALPRIELPRLCRVTLHAPDGKEPKRFEVVRTSGCDFPVRLEPRLAFGSDHWLGPGHYELWWYRDGAPVQRLPFAIARDEAERTLELR